MKKHCLTLVALLLSVCGGLYAEEHDFDFSAECESGQTLYYKITGQNTVDVTSPYIRMDYPWEDFEKPSGKVVVPATVTHDGKTYTVTGIGDYAFKGCSGIKTITLPETITKIGNFAFNRLKNLKEFVFPKGVTSIGSYAFSSGTSLKKIELPAALESIGDFAFQDCTGLKTVTFGPNLKTIGDFAFFSCESLKSVMLPANVKIGSFAFDRATQVGEQK